MGPEKAVRTVAAEGRDGTCPEAFGRISRQDSVD